MHPNAKTTKQIRNYIQNTDKSVSELAAELGISRVTIRKWKNRDTVEDKSHAPNKLSKGLQKHEENVLIFLRELLNLSVDDMLAISKTIFSFKTSRSSLGRLVKRTKQDRGSINNRYAYDGTKLIIIYSSVISKNFAYIILSNTKTKVLHISWIDKNNKSMIFQHLHNELKQFNHPLTLLAKESNDYQYYLESLQRIFMEQEVLFEPYTEGSLQHINSEELIKNISLIISQISKLNHKDFHHVLRAFRFIYNYKTPLKSLREKSPKQYSALKN